jgi:hypothetical protein
LEWLVFVVIGTIGYFLLRSRYSNSKKIAKIVGPGKYAFDVVGESFYEASFVAILGNQAGTRTEWFGDALLKLDDTNPHDSNAVAVFVEGHQVGHLPRDLAPTLRKQILQSDAAGKRQIAVGCRVYAGGENRRFSVTLDFPSA